MRGAPAYLFNYPVIDRTGLTGSWNFDLKWSLRVLSGHSAPPVPDSLTLFDAIDRQLGLKLRLTTIPLPVLVVDSAQPVTQALPAAALEFEVAEIKPENPDDIPKGSSARVDRGGLVDIRMSLRGLLIESLGEMNPDLIEGGPKFMDSEFFEVIAKMPPDDLSPGPAAFNGEDVDTMRLMLGTLLRDRFNACYSQGRSASRRIFFSRPQTQSCKKPTRQIAPAAKKSPALTEKIRASATQCSPGF